MGKSTPSAPQPSNPQNVAHDQSVANVNTALAQSYLNNVNQVTPYGTLKYTPSVEGSGVGTTVEGKYIPTFTATQELTPAGQKLQDTQMAINQGTSNLANQYVSRIADATASPFSYNGLPAAPTYNADYVAKATQGIIDRNQPQMDRDRANLEQRLANQGISVGTPAYQAAMDQYARSVNDFRLGAQSQGQTMAANQYSLEGNTRDRSIQEMTNLRSQPINEVSALLGTGTGVQNPSFVNTPQVQVAPTDIVSAYNNAHQQQYNNYQTQMNRDTATAGGLFGLGGTALAVGAKYGLPLLMGSDIRMKENIRHVGHTHDGQKLYSFNYIGNSKPEIGLMAQEVELIKPDAVHEIGGFKYVDYAKALA